MKKVLLINPDSPYLENAAAYPPMGLMYVASSLRAEGCSVEILDLATKPGYDLSQLRNIYTYDLVGITCVTPNYPTVLEMFKHIPTSDVVTMLGGIHPTLFPMDVFVDTGCSFVVTGEFENVAHDVMTQQQNVFHGGAAKVEKILKPARDLVDLHKYKPGGADATPVYTSRGCPFGCTFCSKLPQSRYREIPLEQVVSEVQDCIDLGFRKFVFGDDNMAVSPHRLRNLLDALKPLGIEFRLNMDSRHPSEDLFRLAAGSGCTEVSFGVESGSPRILAAMNKMLAPIESELAIRYTKQYGMVAKAYFMVNFPGETEETVQETLRFAARAKPDKWLLSSFSPLPGSLVYSHPDRFGIKSMTQDWSKYYLVGKGGVAEPSFETDYLTKEKQKELHRMMYDGLKERLG